MTDEELGRAAYEVEAKNWPSPIGWDNLLKGSQYLWTQRAKESLQRLYKRDVDTDQTA